MKTRSRTKRLKRIDEKVEVITGTNYINNLPPECLFHIFSFLSIEDRLRCTTVCQRWRNFGSEAWHDVKKLDLIILKKIYTEHPRLLALCGGHLKDLTILIPRPDSSIIQNVITNCSKLVKFRVNLNVWYRRTEEHCRDLAELFKKNKTTLRNVVIAHLREQFNGLTSCLLELPEELIELQLRTFKPRMYYRATPCVTFLPVIRKFKNLQILVLGDFATEENQGKIIDNLDDLRHLDINAEGFDIDAIPTRHKLKYLSLGGATTTDSAWFEKLVKNNPDLKHLKLKGCRFDIESNRKLFKLSKLETLSFEDMSMNSSFDSSGFHNLKKFACDQIEDSAVIRLLEVASELESILLSSSWQSPTTPRLLEEAHVIVRRRMNNIPLHIVLDANVIKKWKRPSVLCELFTVQSVQSFSRLADNQYTGYDVDS